MWKFQDIFATQILHEIDFDHFEALKIAILTFWAALNSEFFGFFDIFKREIFPKSKFKASKIVKMAIFDLLKSAKIDLT